MRNDNFDNAQNSSTQKWALLALLCAAPFFFLFALLGEPGRGRAAAGFAAIMFMTIRKFWKLRFHLWFRLTMATLICFHTVLIFLIPWPGGAFPGLTLLPIVALDYGFAYGCIRLVEKMMRAGGAP